jgi:class 3 adenylate cyclase/tetratricopeptide (TPR) repeat protein
MSVCPACGHDNQPGAKFCSECGVALVDAREPAREERKVVTVLFADLVGFTSRAERLDPEDVRQLLSPYYTRLRGELEHFGGTVEKFIGDAVMALFGAPVAHEDDPERAVRAALAIRDWVRQEKELQVRVAVNTGEALITLGARPAEGEGMAAGDVVNTTARLQSAAPVNGVLVGETTYRATRDAIEYREAPPVEAKGKEEPVHVWEALNARARFGVDVPHEARSPLVGRERELDVLRDALGRVREERAPQLLTLAGVPGIGKSRLLFELSRLVDSEPELISWRQGRSLPYGEGVSFWALAEMVKAQAGILESDDAQDAESKLSRMVEELLPTGADAEWVFRHLRVLIGLVGEEPAVGGDRRSEVFAACGRFFEALAEARPLVLVFEDLHWADDGLLDFVDHLVDWASGVPILVVATARPELLERRPGWGGGKANATTLSLAPLSNDDTARLLGSLIGRSVVEAGKQADLLARAGGNPLYAEQYAQMLGERGDEDELPLPESIQGIVGARLDALAAPEKRLLQDAAVIGKVFWASAVAALGDGDDPFALEERLHALERKQFVRRERQTSLGTETQYSFQHVLLRDVAYGQIPRTGRVDKHVLAAHWIESLGRPEDHAEMLAHHYTCALDFARAANRDFAAFVPSARAALRDAGDRARSLNAPAAAIRSYHQALDLWPQDAAAERADLRFRLALAMFEAGDEQTEAALEGASSALVTTGDQARAGELESLIAQLWWFKGQRDRCYNHLERARELVRKAPPSPAKARVLSQVARFRMLAGEVDAEETAEARELAEALGLDEILAQVMITAGTARSVSGEGSARAEIERGLEIALAGNWLDAAIRGYTNLSVVAGRQGDVRESLQFAREAEHVAQRLGNAVQIRWTGGNMSETLIQTGEWDESARRADDFLATSDRAGPHYHDAGIRSARALLRFARGDVAGALEDQEEAIVSAYLAKDPQVVGHTLGISSSLFAAVDRLEEGRRIFDELMSMKDFSSNIMFWLADLVPAAERLDRREEMHAALAATKSRLPWFEVGRMLLDHDYVEAAERYEGMGAAYPAARTRLQAAKELVDHGRRAEADEQLHKALAFFRSVGATRFVREGESLLAASA